MAAEGREWLDFARDEVGHGCFAVDLDGRTQAFHPSLRDALIERGLLYQDRERVWHLRWHGFDLEQERQQHLAICDFCSERPVCWILPCESFSMPRLGPTDPGGESTGAWAACETCGELAAARKKEQLLARSLARHPQLRALRQMQKQLHIRFWRHYQGGAFRVAPHTFGH